MNAEWKKAQAELERMLSPNTYRNWIEPLECHSVTAGKLVLTAPKNTVTWSARRYGGFINEVVKKETSYEGVTFSAKAP